MPRKPVLSDIPVEMLRAARAIWYPLAANLVATASPMFGPAPRINATFAILPHRTVFRSSWSGCPSALLLSRHDLFEEIGFVSVWSEPRRPYSMTVQSVDAARLRQTTS